MKAIIGLAIFLAVFSAAKSFVTTIDSTANVLQKNATRTEMFYKKNNIHNNL